MDLDGLASAFARLASGGLGPEGARVAAAMTEHPALVGFPGSIDTEIMAAAPGVVAKIGAEAVIAIGTPDGRGLAVKVLDGNGRAIDPGAPLEALAEPRIRNSRGAVVGRLDATLR
jgi:L-asparaginase II